jgi:hypothetical protein
MEFNFKTRKETEQEWHDYFQSMSEWKDCFTLFPLEIEEGKYVWLETVQTRYVKKNDPKYGTTWMMETYNPHTVVSIQYTQQFRKKPS